MVVQHTLVGAHWDSRTVQMWVAHIGRHDTARSAVP